MLLSLSHHPGPPRCCPHHIILVVLSSLHHPGPPCHSPCGIILIVSHHPGPHHCCPHHVVLVLPIVVLVTLSSLCHPGPLHCHPHHIILVLPVVVLIIVEGKIDTTVDFPLLGFFSCQPIHAKEFLFYFDISLQSHHFCLDHDYLFCYFTRQTLRKTRMQSHTRCTSRFFCCYHSLPAQQTQP